jgi:hypothetical protein
MDPEEMIAEQALILVPDPVGFENILPSRGAHHHQRPAPPFAASR